MNGEMEKQTGKGGEKRGRSKHRSRESPISLKSTIVFVCSLARWKRGKKALKAGDEVLGNGTKAEQPTRPSLLSSQRERTNRRIDRKC